MSEKMLLGPPQNPALSPWCAARASPRAHWPHVLHILQNLCGIPHCARVRRPALYDCPPTQHIGTAPGTRRSHATRFWPGATGRCMLRLANSAELCCTDPCGRVLCLHALRDGQSDDAPRARLSQTWLQLPKQRSRTTPRRAAPLARPEMRRTCIACAWRERCFVHAIHGTLREH